MADGERNVFEVQQEVVHEVVQMCFAIFYAQGFCIFPD